VVGTHPRVLVVEDDEDVADLLAELLRGRGIETCVARDGHGALDAAREFEPDVALVDLGLPDIDGCEVAKQLRAHAHVRLVALTGYSSAEMTNRIHESGFDEHLLKPVRFEQVDAVIDRLATWS
jgi:DNA-binding response OmpR family regulator